MKCACILPFFVLHQVWLGALNHSSVSDLAVSVAPVVVQWLCLLVAPGSYPVDVSLLLSGGMSGQVIQIPISAPREFCTLRATTHHHHGDLVIISVHFYQASSTVFLGGSLGVESLVAKEQAAFRARVCGSK